MIYQLRWRDEYLDTGEGGIEVVGSVAFAGGFTVGFDGEVTVGFTVYVVVAGGFTVGFAGEVTVGFTV